MRRVTVRIMHPEPEPGAGPLTTWLAGGRAANARRLHDRFVAAGADDVTVVAGPPDTVSFGARLRGLVEQEHPDGIVILGSGSIPLATGRDARDFATAAGSDDRRALANNRYSADAVAVAGAWPNLATLPDLPSDNALPRWLEAHAGYRVDDLRGRWRLSVDIDGPLDLLLVDRRRGREAAAAAGVDVGRVSVAMDAVRRVAADAHAELLVAGRTSARTLAWLELSTASRTRAFVEERGFRAASRLAQASDGAIQRPPASILGTLLDRDGPGSLGDHIARLADGAILDSRVLLAHRLGANERAWPAAEDRYASDLLLPDRVADPWLRALTASAAAAPIPILLGGHTLVGPGIRLVLRGAPWT